MGSNNSLVETFKTDLLYKFWELPNPVLKRYTKERSYKIFQLFILDIFLQIVDLVDQLWNSDKHMEHPAVSKNVNYFSINCLESL
jgi:hypothetical protein